MSYLIILSLKDRADACIVDGRTFFKIKQFTFSFHLDTLGEWQVLSFNELGVEMGRGKEAGVGEVSVPKLDYSSFYYRLWE